MRIIEIIDVRHKCITSVDRYGNVRACPNDARYINSMGQYLCGVCDSLSPWLSVKLTDIPELLRRVETMARTEPTFFNLLKESVCVKPRT